MNKKAFFQRIVVLACVLALFNMAIHYAARNKLSHTTVNKLTSAPQIDTLFLGNSLVQSGIAPEAFGDSWQASGGALKGALHNAGIGGTGAVEHLLLLRAAVQKQKHFGTIVYGIYDFLLTESPDPAQLNGSRSLSFYLEPEVAAQYYAHTWQERLPFLYTQYVPYLVEQSLLWGKVEKIRRGISEIGIARKTQNNEFGRVDDFTALETEPGAFKAHCLDVSQNYKGLSPVGDSLITQAVQHADHVYVVLWPGSPYHRATYYNQPEWIRYQEHIRQSVEKLGAEFVDASEWFPSEEDFSDHLHLSLTSKAPLQFSSRLAKELYSRQQRSGTSEPSKQKP